MKRFAKNLYVLVLFITISCKPPIVLINYGPVHDDISGWEKICSAILRYQNGDTLQYLFDNLLILNDYPWEICFPYVCYMPLEQLGILGLHTENESTYRLNTQNYKDIVSNEVYYFPLYQFKIRDSVVSFHKLTQEEQMRDTRKMSATIYAKGEKLRVTEHFRQYPDFLPEVKMIYNQCYEVKYKYLIGSDTASWYNTDYFCENPLTNISLFYLPLDTNVYYKKYMRKYLVKKRLGFCLRYEDREEFRQLADYRHEIDTALLALPVRIFQERYLKTNDIYCLDGLSVNRFLLFQ